MQYYHTLSEKGIQTKESPRKRTKDLPSRSGKSFRRPRFNIGCRKWSSSSLTTVTGGQKKRAGNRGKKTHASLPRRSGDVGGEKEESCREKGWIIPRGKQPVGCGRYF